MESVSNIIYGMIHKRYSNTNNTYNSLNDLHLAKYGTSVHIFILGNQIHNMVLDKIING